MKNTISFNVDVCEKEIIIEGICPHCLEDNDLLELVDVLYFMFNESYKIAKERNLYGEKKQGTQKKRQKDFRKSCRQNKKD